MSHTQVTPIDVEGSHVDPPARTGTPQEPFVQDVPTPTASNLFSAEQIEKARREERDKHQRALARAKEQSDAMKAELEQLRAAQAETQKQKEAEARKEAKRRKSEDEKDLSAREILACREQEWEQQMAQLRHEQEQTRALVALERQHMQMETYKNSRVAEEIAAQRIAPQFKDYIGGTTQDEIEASIELAKQKSAEIAAEFQQLTAQASRYTGVSTNFGPSNIGSRDQLPEPEIDATKLSYAEFVKNRDRLIVQHKDQGLFN